MYRNIFIILLFFGRVCSAMDDTARVPATAIAQYVVAQQKIITAIKNFQEKETACNSLWYSVDALRLPPEQFAREFEDNLLSLAGAKPCNRKLYYQIFGLTPEEGKRMHYTTLRANIAAVREGISPVSKTSREAQANYNQAMYAFSTPFSKECYDAYLAHGLKKFLGEFQARIVKQHGET